MELDLALVEMYCDEAMDLLNRWEIIGLDLLKSGNTEHYQELFRIAHNLKGGSHAVGLMSFGDFIHKVEDGITLLRDNILQTNSKTCDLLLESQKVLSDWIQIIKLDPLFNFDTKSFILKFEKVFVINQTLDFSKESIDSNIEINNTTTELSDKEKKSFVKNNLKKSAQSNESIRIPAHKLDELIQVIGELSIHQSIVWHTRNQTSTQDKMFLKSLQLGQKLTKELYDKALSLRMQPIQSVFQRLERNILDLSRSLNKSVNVEIIGGDVELDKSVIERIIDPLTHIVRNAIDHGIEDEQTRSENHKSIHGLIKIIAKKDTFGVELTIKDDGKGLAISRILKKAIEKKLILENENLSKKEILNLIFLPGFSTADQVTDVSGRGVGMDVVRRTLEELQGSIHINSEEGLGTEFQITLPTSVSIIDAMLVELSGQNYVVPVGAVDEVIYLNDALTDNCHMIKHNESILPVKNLNTILSHRRNINQKNNKTETKTILVCKYKNKKLGLAIDRVIGQQQIVIRPLNDNINGAFGLQGGTILGNGEPGLILDIAALNDYFIAETQNMENAS